MIKIADSSEYGWQVVAEYEADELVSGSEDEKKIEKAEKAAERKAQKKKRGLGKPGSRSFSGKFHQAPGAAAVSNHRRNGRKYNRRARCY